MGTKRQSPLFRIVLVGKGVEVEQGRGWISFDHNLKKVTVVVREPASDHLLIIEPVT